MCVCVRKKEGEKKKEKRDKERERKKRRTEEIKMLAHTMVGVCWFFDLCVIFFNLSKKSIMKLSFSYCKNNKSVAIHFCDCKFGGENDTN